MYSNATAPFRKYMLVVAGSPVSDCPNACSVMTWLPRDHLDDHGPQALVRHRLADDLRDLRRLR